MYLQELVDVYEMNAQGGAPRAPTLESQLESQESSASLQSTSLEIDFEHQQLHEKNVENKFINNLSENYEKTLNNNAIDSLNLLKSTFATNSRVAFNLNCDTSYNSLESNNLLKTAGNQSFHQRNNLMFENMVTASSVHQNMDGMGFSSQVPGLPDNYPHHHSEMIGSNSISMNSNMNNFFPMNNMEYNGMGPMMTMNEMQKNNLSGLNINHSMLSNRGEGFIHQVNSLDHSNSFHLGKQQNISPMNHIQNLAMSIGGMTGNTNMTGGGSMMGQARSPIANGHNHQHISNMHPMTKMMSMTNNNFSQHRRIAPYPSPQKKNCPPVMSGAMHVSNYGNPHVPLHLQQHPNQMQYSDHPSLNGLPSPMSSTNYNYNRNISSLGGGIGCVQRQPTPPYTNPMQHQFYSNSNHNTPNTSGISNSYTNFQNYQQDMRMNINNFQHSPVPGNPTPPLTPACSIPYVSPNPDAKPQIDNRDEEMRLTFPVRDGIILAPFRLLHNLSVSNHVFNLKATVFSTLMSRSDLELQLKCFHQEDRQMNTNWPQTVTVSANATPLVIERSEKNGHAFKPLYLKQVCQPGRNTLQLTASSCCCSHLFVLQLVHRPSVRQVLHSLHRRNLLPVQHSVAKIKQFFALGLSGQIPPSRDSVAPVNGDFMQISLKCPITKNRIKFPARGHECKHIQCFDLESYLLLNCERGSWRCPICNNPALTEGLEIDQYMWAILNTLNQSLAVDEVTIDQFGNWQKVTNGNSEMEQLLNQNSCVLNPEEDSNLYKNNSNSIKQEVIEKDDFKNNSIVMSPGSTAIPIWENSQAMSPYMCHDMNSIVNGNMIGQSPQNKFDSFGNIPNENVSGTDPLSQMNDTISSLNSINGVKNSKEHMPFTSHAAGGVPSHLLAQNVPQSVNSLQNENLNSSKTDNNESTHSNSQDNSTCHDLSQPQDNLSSQNNNQNNQLPSFIQESQQHQYEPSSPSKNNKNKTDTLTSYVDNSSDENNQKFAKGNNLGQQQNQIIDSFLSSQNESLINLNETDLNENLNFDSSGADSDPTNELNLLSNSLVDPMEILKYLDPQPNLNTPPSSGSSSNPNQDENILASLFD